MTEAMEMDDVATAALRAGPVPALTVGYDSITGALRATAITAMMAPPEESSSSVSIVVCEGTVEMSEALQVKQSLSADYLGIVKVDQKLEFIRRQKTTSQSVSMVVYANKIKEVQTAVSPTLSIDTTGMSTADFVRQIGDSFFNSISYGGEYYAVYTFYTETKEDQTSLATSLKTEIAKAKNKLDIEVQTEINNFVSTTKTSWKFDQQVSGLNKPGLPDRGGIVGYALGFSDRDFDAPSVVDTSTQGYEHAVGFNLDFDQIKANRRYFIGDSGNGGLAAKVSQIASLKNKVAWLDDIYQCYDYTGDTGLDTFDKLLDADLTTIHDQFVTYTQHPVQSFKEPTLPSLAKGTPMLAYVKSTSPAWGKGGGAPFGYGNVESALANQRRLTWLRLRGGKYVDRIALQYSDVHGKGPVQSFGRDGGSDQIPLSFDANEFISSMTTYHGAVVDMAIITTNKGSTTQVGRDGGQPSVWNAKPGQIVLGIEGRAGKYVDMLRLVVVEFEAAKFVKKT